MGKKSKQTSPHRRVTFFPPTNLYVNESGITDENCNLHQLMNLFEENRIAWLPIFMGKQSSVKRGRGCPSSTTATSAMPPSARDIGRMRTATCTRFSLWPGAGHHVAEPGPDPRAKGPPTGWQSWLKRPKQSGRADPPPGEPVEPTPWWTNDLKGGRAALPPPMLCLTFALSRVYGGGRLLAGSQTPPPWNQKKNNRVFCLSGPCVGHLNTCLPLRPLKQIFKVIRFVWPLTTNTTKGRLIGAGGWGHRTGRGGGMCWNEKTTIHGGPGFGSFPPLRVPSPSGVWSTPTSPAPPMGPNSRWAGLQSHIRNAKPRHAWRGKIIRQKAREEMKWIKIEKLNSLKLIAMGNGVLFWIKAPAS